MYLINHPRWHNTTYTLPERQQVKIIGCLLLPHNFKISYFNLHILKQGSIHLHVGVIKEYYLVTNFMTFFFHLVISGINSGTLGPVFSLPQFLCPGVRF